MAYISRRFYLLQVHLKNLRRPGYPAQRISELWRTVRVAMWKKIMKKDRPKKAAKISKSEKKKHLYHY